MKQGEAQMREWTLRTSLVLLALLAVLLAVSVRSWLTPSADPKQRPGPDVAPVDSEPTHGGPAHSNSTARQPVFASIRGQVLFRGAGGQFAPDSGRLRIRHGLGNGVGTSTVTTTVERGIWRLDLDSTFTPAETLLVESFEADSLTLTDCEPRAFDARDGNVTLTFGIAAWLDLVVLDASSDLRIHQPDILAADPRWTPTSSAAAPKPESHRSIVVEHRGEATRIVASKRIDNLWVGSKGYLWTRPELTLGIVNRVELHKESVLHVTLDGQVMKPATVIVDQNVGPRSVFHEVRRAEVFTPATTLVFDRLAAGLYRIRARDSEQGDTLPLGQVEVSLASGASESVLIQLPATGLDSRSSLIARFHSDATALSILRKDGLELVCAEAGNRDTSVVRAPGAEMRDVADGNSAGIETGSIACRPGWYWLQSKALSWGRLIEVLPGENRVECAFDGLAPVQVRIFDNETSDPVHTTFAGVVSADRSADVEHTAFPSCIQRLTLHDGVLTGNLVTGPAVLVATSPTHGAIVTAFEHRLHSGVVDLHVGAAPEVEVELFVDGDLVPIDLDWLARIRAEAEEAHAPSIVNAWTSRDSQGRIRARLRLSNRHPVTLRAPAYLGLAPLVPARVDWSGPSTERVVRFTALQNTK